MAASTTAASFRQQQPSAAMLLLQLALLLTAAPQTSNALAFKLPKIELPKFGIGGVGRGAPTLLAGGDKNIKAQKLALLEAVSFTNNGKTATTEQQVDVLKRVRQLELARPAPDNLLTDPATAQKLIDGTWYLQYTSPSQVDGVDFDQSWTPEFASEGTANIPTAQFSARGSVSAVGVTVDTSNRVVEQNIDAVNKRVENVVFLDWGRVRAAGTFRPSRRIPTRAVVAFDTLEIRLGEKENSPAINLGWVFSALGALRKSKESGWLETTYIDDDVRIGRGNKGTMFVLTRDSDAVKP